MNSGTILATVVAVLLLGVWFSTSAALLPEVAPRPADRDRAADPVPVPDPLFGPPRPILDDGAALAATTDGDGAFVFRTEPGARLDLRLTGLRFLGGGPPVMDSWRGEAKGIVAPARGIVIPAERLDDDRTLTVLVLDTDGRPMPKVEVAVGGRWLLTGPDGIVRFERLLAEGMEVSIRGRVLVDPREGLVAPAPVAIVPEGQVLEMRFVRGVFIEGIVLGPGGDPAPLALVRLTTEDRTYSTVSGLGGRFAVAVPPGETCKVRAVGRVSLETGKPMTGAVDGVQAGSTGVTVRLAETP